MHSRPNACTRSLVVAVGAFVLLAANSMSPEEPAERDRAATVTGFELLGSTPEDAGAGRVLPVFAAGSPVELVLAANGSDEPALLEVEWRDARGRPVDISRVALSGSQAASIQLSPRIAALESGKYHAVILVDGEPVEMADFRVR